MKTPIQFVLVFIAFTAVRSKPGPVDDGNYDPKKYNVFDDGRYYRPLQEGKYVHTDDGKYTYVYKQDPEQIYKYVHEEGPNGRDDNGDYRYIHQVGPDGGFGGNGGFGGYGGYGPNGPGGPNGPRGPKGPNGPNGQDPNNYANRYPYIHKIINSLVNEYVSGDYLSSAGSSNHYSKVFADKEVALKCQYLSPNGAPTQSELVTQYPPSIKVQPGENPGAFYSFKGTRTLNEVANSLNTKLKLEYEVIVRVTEVVN